MGIAEEDGITASRRQGCGGRLATPAVDEPAAGAFGG